MAQPLVSDVTDYRLAAVVDVNVLDRNFLRALAAMSVQRFEQGAGCLCRPRVGRCKLRRRLADPHHLERGGKVPETEAQPGAANPGLGAGGHGGVHSGGGLYQRPALACLAGKGALGVRPR